jgi:phage N-6-adenine-methyltransferase
MIELEYHPLSNLFPLLDGEEFAALVADIRAHGQREPIIITTDNLILDGRNRYRACREAGVDPDLDLYRGDDESMAAFVVSLNLKRRHLNESQRAVVAAKLANLEHGGDRSKRPIGHLKQSEAADMLNVGDRSLRRAREVLDEGAPELVQAVEAGRVAVSAATEILDLSPEEQAQIVALSPSEMRDAIKHHRTQFTGDNEWYTPAQHIEAARAVLGAFDLDPATSEFAQERVKASNYFTQDDDGLAHEWFGRVWLNPPYAQPYIMQFIEKLVAEFDGGRVEQAILLTHNYTDTAWFHLAESRAARLCFTRGRIKFEKPDGIAAPTQGQTFFYFGKNSEAFERVFKEYGFIR